MKVPNDNSFSLDHERRLALLTKNARFNVTHNPDTLDKSSSSSSLTTAKAAADLFSLNPSEIPNALSSNGSSAPLVKKKHVNDQQNKKNCCQKAIDCFCCCFRKSKQS